MIRTNPNRPTTIWLLDQVHFGQSEPAKIGVSEPWSRVARLKKTTAPNARLQPATLHRVHSHWIFKTEWISITFGAAPVAP
jgi:hypothetical protein